MENASELLREPSSYSNSQIMLKGCAKRQVERGRFSRIACSMTYGSTGGETIPKAFINDIDPELGKPVLPLWLHSRSTARKAVGNAGRGNLKKRTPPCNGAYRGKASERRNNARSRCLNPKGCRLQKGLEA